MLLGIDTSTAVASVALVEGGKVVREEVHAGHNASSSSGHANHSEILLPLVDSVLTKASVSLSDISAMAVSIGPGSFTGLRIGLSTVKGLAYGSNIPVVGVPTLLALAMRVSDWEGLICPLLDARKKEVYAALFKRAEGRLERLTEDGVSSHEKVFEEIRALRSSGPCLFIGDGIRVYGDLIRASLGERSLLASGDAYPSTATAVARLAEERVLHEEFDPLGPLSPLYLRPSEAEAKRGKTSGMARVDKGEHVG